MGTVKHQSYDATPRPPPPAMAASAAASTYTTIPISGTDVIFRSFQNLSSYISSRRPWPDFISGAPSFSRPSSASDAETRLRLNMKYFGVNYSIIVSICAVFSLTGVPSALIVYSFVFVLWLVFYFFREDPMAVWGYHVNGGVVTVGLVLVTAMALWFTGFLNNLLAGVGAGLLIVGIHGVFRNPEGHFLDENDAATNGLIVSPSGARSARGDFSI